MDNYNKLFDLHLHSLCHLHFLYHLLFYLGAINTGVKLYKCFVYSKRRELESPTMELKYIRTLGSSLLHLVYLLIIVALRVFIMIDLLYPIMWLIYLFPISTIIVKTVFEVGVNSNSIDKNISNCIITLSIIIVYLYQIIFTSYDNSEDVKFNYYFISSSIYYISINDMLWSILSYYIVPHLNYSIRRSFISTLFYLLSLYLNISCAFTIVYEHLCVLTILLYIITPITIHLTLPHYQSFL